MSLITSARDASVNMFDTLMNLITGIGTSKDARTGAAFVYEPLTRFDIDSMYRSDWLARRLVDLPAYDATREWRQWNAPGKQLEKIQWLEAHLNIPLKVRRAITLSRLYGGAALVLGVDQGAPDEELDIDSVGLDQLKFVVVCHCWEMSAGPRIYDVMSPYYGRPEYYTVATPTTGMMLNRSPRYNGNSIVIGPDPAPRNNATDLGIVRIHPSRVIEFAGADLPDWRLAPLGGLWGDSILQTIDEELRDFGMIRSGIASLVNDMKMDVVRIPNLTQALSTSEKSAKTLNRFRVANMAKSSINTLLLDKEEEWQRITTSFGSTPDLIRVAVTIACGAGGVPESRVMGSAPNKGLAGAGGSGGEVDIRNYYDDIAARQKTDYKPALYILDRCIQQSALGKFDPHIDYVWSSLYQPTPQEKAQTALVKAQTTQAIAGTGLINEDALRDALVSQLTEDQIYPGLEAAIDKYGAAPEEPEQPEEPPAPPPGFLPKGQFEPNPFHLLKAQAATAAQTAANSNKDPAPSPASPRSKVKDFNPNHDDKGLFATSGASALGGSEDFNKAFAELAAKYPNQLQQHLAKIAGAVHEGEASEAHADPGSHWLGGEEVPHGVEEAKRTWAGIANGVKAIGKMRGLKTNIDSDVTKVVTSAVGHTVAASVGHLVQVGYQAGIEHLTEKAGETVSETLKEMIGHISLHGAGAAAGAKVGALVGAIAGPAGVAAGAVGGAVVGGAVGGKLAGHLAEHVAKKLGLTPEVAGHLVAAGARATSHYLSDHVLRNLDEVDATLGQMQAYHRATASIPMAGAGYTGDALPDDIDTVRELIDRVRLAIQALDALANELEQGGYVA